MAINAAWHQRNPMPRGASQEQRLAWHLRHQTRCGCRPIPASLRRAMAASGQSQRER